ncbi:uncharacterized protein [Clytia hemisphaerica]|uniref:Cytosine deaminase n=1 Tax=Clytia hemisphaerica TaxID=252671 RepID=A0A7M5XFG6_9CNID|eukprot:TCONS_00050435-protein
MTWVNLNWLDAAMEEAKQGLREGGIPIGSVLVDPETGNIVARGHNRRIQNGDPTAHAEMECFKNAGRRKDWHKLVLVSTLSPCPMCSGTAILYKVPRIIVGENINYTSPAEKWLTESKVTVHLEQNKECIDMMENFIKTKPGLWNEDIHDI